MFRANEMSGSKQMLVLNPPPAPHGGYSRIGVSFMCQRQLSHKTKHPFLMFGCCMTFNKKHMIYNDQNSR